MAPIFISFLAATGFGLVCNLVLGSEHLLDHPWIDTTFWALLSAGLVVSLCQYVWDTLPRPVLPHRQAPKNRVRHVS